MGYEAIKYEMDDHIAIITLNRPGALNAMNTPVVREMLQAIDEADRDDNVRVIIITGAPRPDGRPCFSAGGDLKRDPKEVDFNWLLEIRELFHKVEDFLKPVIAAIDGVCTGGGIELAAACDIRLASETAQISDFHLKNLGLGVGGAGAASRVSRIVGLARAKQLIFTGQVLNGREAEKWGFVNEVFPPDKLMEGAKDMARKIAAMRPSGVRMALAHMDLAMQMDFYQAMRHSDTIPQVLRSAREPDAGAREWDSRKRRGPD